MYLKLHNAYPLQVGYNTGLGPTFYTNSIPYPYNINPQLLYQLKNRKNDSTFKILPIK